MILYQSKDRGEPTITSADSRGVKKDQQDTSFLLPVHHHLGGVTSAEFEEIAEKSST